MQKIALAIPGKEGGTWDTSASNFKSNMSMSDMKLKHVTFQASGVTSTLDLKKKRQVYDYDYDSNVCKKNIQVITSEPELTQLLINHRHLPSPKKCKATTFLGTASWWTFPVPACTAAISSWALPVGEIWRIQVIQPRIETRSPQSPRSPIATNIHSPFEIASQYHAGERNKTNKIGHVGELRIRSEQSIAYMPGFYCTHNFSYEFASSHMSNGAHFSLACTWIMWIWLNMPICRYAKQHISMDVWQNSWTSFTAQNKCNYRARVADRFSWSFPMLRWSRVALHTSHTRHLCKGSGKTRTVQESRQ